MEKNLQDLQNRYLRTSRMITIRHLCKFLAKKFDADPRIFKITLSPRDMPLNEDLTLDVIDSQAWNSIRFFLFMFIFSCSYGRDPMNWFFFIDWLLPPYDIIVLYR